MKTSIVLIFLVSLCHVGVYSSSISPSGVMENLDSVLQSILERLNNLEQKLEDIKAESNFFKDEDNSLKEKIQHILSILTSNFQREENTPSSPTSSVVFSAELGADQSGQGVVKFDKVVANIGEGYDKNSGQFTAPEAGVYYFTATANVKENAGFYIQHGNKMAPAFIKFSEKKQQLTTIGTNVVLNLEKGEKVWVGLRMGTLMGTEEHVYTSFTGFRLA